MICPHCKKLISFKKQKSSQEIMEVLSLHKEGYSTRDIEKLLFTKNIMVSFSTVARIVKEYA